MSDWKTLARRVELHCTGGPPILQWVDAIHRVGEHKLHGRRDSAIYCLGLTGIRSHVPRYEKLPGFSASS